MGNGAVQILDAEWSSPDFVDTFESGEVQNELKDLEADVNGLAQEGYRLKFYSQSEDELSLHYSVAMEREVSS